MTTSQVDGCQLKINLKKTFSDKIPKSKEFEFDQTKSKKLLEMICEKGHVTFKDLLGKYKIDVIHYNRECDPKCSQKMFCNISRKSCDIGKWIVKDLQSSDRLFKLVDSPFVVGSTKEQTKIFSIGKFNILLIQRSCSKDQLFR